MIDVPELQKRIVASLHDTAAKRVDDVECLLYDACEAITELRNEVFRLTKYNAELAETVEQRARELREAQAAAKASQHLFVVVNDAINDGGWDVSPCCECGTPVVCLPDGLPCCKNCAEKNQ